MVRDAVDELITEIRKLRKTMSGGTDVSVKGGGGTTVQETSVAVPGEGGPLTETSPVFTTGEAGVTITSPNFTSEGRFAFGFPSRIVYLRTEDAPVVVEFDGENNPTRQIPVPAAKGEITLGDGGAGFRAESVNIKLARNASANETTVHVIAYR